MIWAELGQTPSAESLGVESHTSVNDSLAGEGLLNCG